MSFKRNQIFAWVTVVGLLALLAGIAVTFTQLTTKTATDNRSQASTPADNGSLALNIPESQVQPFRSGEWKFEVSNQNDVESNWQVAGDETPPGESQVFWQRLTHSQPNKNWTIKLGKGGQLYSISMPQTGELIARQRVSHGEWVDEVFQHTIPSDTHRQSPGSNIVDGDIHQAGYYTKSDLNPKQKILPHSVYSPTFASLIASFRAVPESVTFMTWPQHAHLPRTYSENGMVLQQVIRDMGDGVIEISGTIDKWAGEETSSISLPWSGLRTETLPVQIISEASGGHTVKNQVFGDAKVVRLTDNSTGGWMAFAQANQAEAYGLGIVFGAHKPEVENSTSYIRWGTYNAGTVATVKRAISLKPGDTLFFRYYLVLGTLKDIKKYGNLLATKVQLQYLDTQNLQPGSVEICPDAANSLRRGCPEGSSPLFTTDRYHTRAALPVFLLQNTLTREHILSTDPYAISSDPTDGKTKYLEFLGWVKPEIEVAPAKGSSCWVSQSGKLTLPVSSTRVSELLNHLKSGQNCQ